MTRYALRGIGPPLAKHQEILDYLFTPSEDVKKVDVCCGRGFGKSVLMIVAAVKALSQGRSQRGLILEPDRPRMRNVFLRKWLDIVHPELYTHNKGEQIITWRNGAKLRYGHRNVTGSQEIASDREAGDDLTFVISDEESLKTNPTFYVQTFNTIRIKAPARFYLTIATPRVGSYERLVLSPGHKLFRGTSYDNWYRPKGYVSGMMANMTRDQIRREIYGEFISLEGRIWKDVIYTPFDPEHPDADIGPGWPESNRDDLHPTFKPGKEWYLLSDIGSATGAYIGVQPVYDHSRGYIRWVAFAEYCPQMSASVRDACLVFKSRYGNPTGYSAGGDVDTRGAGDGKTPAFFIHNIFDSHTQINPVREDQASKQVQFALLSRLFGPTGDGKRRLTIARDFVSLDPDSYRGIREMIREDSWKNPDERRPSDYLPKNKEVLVQHIRDALLMGAAAIMGPPEWGSMGDI